MSEEEDLAGNGLGNKPVILLVEDEPRVRSFIRAGLEGRSFRVVEATGAAEGLTTASQHVPDVLLLDLGLPDMDGLEVIRRIRSWSAMPIIVLSARGQEQDKVLALDEGADDYITKPFTFGELLARIRVALRHARGTQAVSGILVAGPVRIDLDARRVWVDDHEVHLTPIEYKLTSLLAKNAGKVMTHKALLEGAWGPNSGERTHYLRVYMTQLRRKLERDRSQPRVLVTIPGVGHRLDV